MRVVCLILVAAVSSFAAQDAPSDNGPQAIVQQLFTAIAAHNVDAVRSLFTPNAVLLSVKDDGTPSRMRYEDFTDLLATTKNVWLERIWNPTVLIHGPIAVVWAEYDFHLNGNLSHCGVDSVSLLKTSSGWKISSISDTRETSGCTSPLGPLHQ
jgi:SnoaL-like domain